MLVLFWAVFLLGVIPAILLWLGRMIEANTDGRSRIKARQAQAAALQGDGDPGRAPWFSQPMRPVFGNPRQAAPARTVEASGERSQVKALPPGVAELRHGGGTSRAPWFRQPVKPILGKPNRAA